MNQPIRTLFECELASGAEGEIRLSRRTSGPAHIVFHPGYARRPDVLLLARDSAGLLDGDSCEIRLVVKRGVNVVVSEPGPTNVLTARSEQIAEQSVHVEVRDGARLAYLPHAIVPFAGSRSCLRTTIDVEPGATLVFASVLSPGRTALDEVWQQGILRQSVRLTADGEPLWFEVIGLHLKRPRTVGHLFSMLVYGHEVIPLVREMRRACPDVAVSALTDDLICVRGMSDGTEGCYSSIRGLMSVMPSPLCESTWARIGLGR